MSKVQMWSRNFTIEQEEMSCGVGIRIFTTEQEEMSCGVGIRIFTTEQEEQEEQEEISMKE